jgi:hypothetical protein
MSIGGVMELKKNDVSDSIRKGYGLTRVECVLTELEKNDWEVVYGPVEEDGDFLEERNPKMLMGMELYRDLGEPSEIVVAIIPGNEILFGE